MTLNGFSSQLRDSDPAALLFVAKACIKRIGKFDGGPNCLCQHTLKVSDRAPRNNRGQDTTTCLVLRLTGFTARLGEVYASNFASATVKPLVSRKP